MRAGILGSALWREPEAEIVPTLEEARNKLSFQPSTPYPAKCALRLSHDL
jgi:hypothetical protein